MKPELFYVATKALLFEKDKLLLVKKREPCFWDVPGGRIDPGESILEAFKREMAEELPDFRHYEIKRLVGARRKEGVIKDGNGLFLIYFLVHSTSQDNKYTLSDEHTEYQFFSKTEISKLETPFNEIYSGLMDQVLSPGTKKLSQESAIVF